MPTLCVSVPVAAPTTTIGRPMLLAGERFDLVLAHVLDVEALVAQRGVVDRLRRLAEHHEVRVAVGQLLVVDDLGVLEAHLRRQLLRGLARRQAVGDGQREAELHDPVAEVVGVRLARARDRPPADGRSPASAQRTARRPPHQLARRVQVALVDLDDALRAAALVDLARDVAEHAFAERREQADLGDPLEQLVRSRRAPPARASG